MITARFAYGPLDLASLSYEKVHVYLLKAESGSQWIHATTVETSKHGKISIPLPDQYKLGCGTHTISVGTAL